MSKASLALSTIATLAWTGMAAAQDALPVIGRPHQGGVGFQPASTVLARDLQWLDHFILIIITGIVLLVGGALCIAFLRPERLGAILQKRYVKEPVEARSA